MSIEQSGTGYGPRHEEPNKDITDQGNPFGGRETGPAQVDVFHVPEHGSRTVERTEEDSPDFTAGLPAAPAPERPTYIPAPREAETETKEKRRVPLWVTVGSFAAGLAIAGGAFLGISRSGNNDKAGPAPTNPVPTLETPPATGAQSSHEATPTTPEQLDANTYVFTVDGKEYKGQSELVAAMGVDAEKYPTYKEATVALIDRLNLWLNTGGEAKDLQQAENYKNGDGLHTGLAGVEEDIQDIAWLTALTDGPVADSDLIKEWSHDHINNISYRLKSKDAGEQTPYERKIILDQATNGLVGRNTGSINPGPYEGTIYSYYHVEDNAYPNTTMGKLRRESPDGFDGITATPFKSKPQVLYITLGTKEIETPDHKVKNLVVIEDIKSREVTG